MNRYNQTLKIATSQFQVSEDIASNTKYIKKHIAQASRLHADVIHFPEMSLSGYNTTIEDIDWGLLNRSLDEVRLLAKKYNMYVVLGLHHISDQPGKAFDTTLLLSNKGQTVGKYSKQKLYGSEKNRFIPEKNFLTYKIKGVKCGFLISYDSCFPELFLVYKKQGIKLLFLSYYNANSAKPRNSMDALMKAQFITRATDSQMYISGSNSSSKYSRMPSSFVRPDGRLTTLKRHTPGILLSDYPGSKLGWIYDNGE
ncbi:MAG: carbon-nitrogen hydrolase family protein [Candidatus Roizmanbacteria bacterium]|nr:carbon-nitrogen hydrolase family protein [Candidatus Roizmanbacteria bacterium]